MQYPPGILKCKECSTFTQMEWDDEASLQMLPWTHPLFQFHILDSWVEIGYPANMLAKLTNSGIA